MTDRQTTSRHRLFWLILILLCSRCSVPLPIIPEALPVVLTLKVPPPKLEANQVFVTRGRREFKMDVFRPVRQTEPGPAVILVHGGFWIFGDKTEMDDWATDLAVQGYVAASIDYRLLPDGGKFPAPIADVLAAIEHLRSHADEWQIDPDRIALFGVSSGGHLVLEAGMPADAGIFDPAWPAGTPAGVRAIVDIYGPTDFTGDLSTAQFWQLDLLESFLGGTRDERPDVWREASPITYVRADGPPVFILHGSIDPAVPISQARSLSEAMDAVGQAHQFIEILGAGHFWGTVWTGSYDQRYRPDILAFLSDHLQ